MYNTNLLVPELVERKVLSTGSIPGRIQMVEFEVSPVPELVEGKNKRPFPISLAFEPTTQRAKGKKGEGNIFPPFDKLRDQKQMVKIVVRRAGNIAPLFFDKLKEEKQVLKIAVRRAEIFTPLFFDRFSDQINIEMPPVNRIDRFESVSFDRLDTYSETTDND